MITSLAVDNYRCFSGFYWAPRRFNLLLGENGSGKTSILDVLESLREMITRGEPTETVFPAQSLCRWRSERDGAQQFIVEIEGNGGSYTYALKVEHELPRGSKSRISSERLTYNGQAVFEFDGREIHLYRDDGSVGPVFPFDWSRSGIATVPERPDNTRLTWFRNRMSSVRVFSPDPPAMKALVKTASGEPSRSLHNLAEWLYAVQSADFEIGAAVSASLRESIAGFAKHRFARVGSSTHELFVDFAFQQNGDSPITNRFELSFDALSEGHRNLFALYSILHAAVRPGATVCLDEPDNFLALHEIQPWLSGVQYASEDTGCQIFLVSHHPELINQMAASYGTLFERDSMGVISCRRFEWRDKEHITPAELVARGWE